MSHLIYNKDNVLSARMITPWHNIGDVKENVTLEDLYRNFDWEVVKEPLYTLNKERTSTYATIRMPDRIILGDKLSKDYQVLQNKDLIKIIEPLVESGCAIETAGTLQNGKNIWVLLRLASDLVIGENDVIQQYILISNNHSGKHAVKFGTVGIRVVCNNTLQASYTDNTSKLIRIYHQGDVIKNTMNVVDMLDHINGQFLSYGEKLNTLANKSINQYDLKAYVKKVFFPQITEENEAKHHDKIVKLQQQIELIFNEGPGSNLNTAKGTAFGLYQAANYYLNHETKGTTEKRLTSLVYGQNATKDYNAFQEALALTI